MKQMILCNKTETVLDTKNKQAVARGEGVGKGKNR